MTQESKNDRYRHVRFSREDLSDLKRKRPQGPHRGPAPDRDNRDHGKHLIDDLEEIRHQIKFRDYPAEINPRLIFIIEEKNKSHELSDSDFIKASLTPLFVHKEGRYVLFSDDGQAAEFQKQLHVTH